MRGAIALFIILLAANLGLAAAPRTWTSSDGKFQVFAELVEVKANSVRLRRPDGQVLEIAVAQLSDADRNFLARTPRPNPAPPMGGVGEPGTALVRSGEKPAFVSDPDFAEVMRQFRKHNPTAARDAIKAIGGANAANMEQARKACDGADMFWEMAPRGVSLVQPGDEILIKPDEPAVISEIDQSSVVIRYQARNHRFNLREPEKVPYRLALYFVSKVRLPNTPATRESLQLAASLGLNIEDPARWEAAAIGVGPRPRPGPLNPLVEEKPLAPVEEPVEKKLPIPSADARQKAQAEVRELMKKDLDAAKSAPQKYELARNFVTLASQSFPKDGPGSFALVMEACDLCATSGNVVGALEMVDWISSHFEVPDANGARARMYLKAIKALPAVSNIQAVSAQKGLDMVDDLANAGNFTLANDVCDAALVAARASRQKELIQQLTDKKKSVVEVQAAETELVAVRQVLATKPDDPDSNLKIGAFTTFSRRDWAAGLPQLAKGSDAELAAAAKLDLAEPGAAPQQMEVADAWWNLSENPKHKSHAAALLERAKHWYQQALPNLSGLAKLKAEKRIGGM